MPGPGFIRGQPWFKAGLPVFGSGQGCGGEGECTASFQTEEIEPSIFRFTDTSTPSPGATIINWEWDFGDGKTSGVQNPLHEFKTFGFFDVVLTITDSRGCMDSATGRVFCCQPCENKELGDTGILTVSVGGCTEENYPCGSSPYQPEIANGAHVLDRIDRCDFIWSLTIELPDPACGNNLYNLQFTASYQPTGQLWNLGAGFVNRSGGGFINAIAATSFVGPSPCDVTLIPAPFMNPNVVCPDSSMTFNP